MCHNGFFDGYRVQLLAVGKNNDVVGSTAMCPVVRECRMLPVQIFGVVLIRIGKGVEEALETWIFVLANDNLLVDSLLVSWAPLTSKCLGVEDEIVPQLRVGLPVNRVRGESRKEQSVNR
jgi:hypothetical protein